MMPKDSSSGSKESRSRNNFPSFSLAQVFRRNSDKTGMEKKIPFSITREKHLDHLVRVVPLIVMGYAIQSYILLQMETAIGMGSILFLGVALAAMVAGFVTYDLKQKVTIFEDRLESEFFFFRKTIYFHEITSVDISETKQTFASIIIRTGKKKKVYYFIDQPEDIRNLIQEHKTPLESAA